MSKYAKIVKFRKFLTEKGYADFVTIFGNNPALLDVSLDDYLRVTAAENFISSAVPFELVPYSKNNSNIGKWYRLNQEWLKLLDEDKPKEADK